MRGAKLPSSSITVIPYIGSVLAADLLAGSTTLVLSNFGSPQSGTLSDNDGLLENADDGVATFNGAPINYIGSGSATGGAEVAGIFIGVGPTVDVVVFEAAGQIFFHYPDGQPALAQLLLNVNISAAPYEVFTPVCFAADTLILTPDGERTIQELQVGDWITDFYGEEHEIIWTGSRKLSIPRAEAFKNGGRSILSATPWARACPSGSPGYHSNTGSCWPTGAPSYALDRTRCLCLPCIWSTTVTFASTMGLMKWNTAMSCVPSMSCCRQTGCLPKACFQGLSRWRVSDGRRATNCWISSPNSPKEGFGKLQAGTSFAETKRGAIALAADGRQVAVSLNRHL